ncbi:MAG: DUF2461 domain-containing protein [Candidatus Solibacter usitatus]|nr:DUF2461 domain-containing protein [Candidatus Solibacter usitatus]
MSHSFAGIPKEGMAFLRALKKNNNREWFQPRKEIFERSMKEPMEQLVEAVNSKLIQFAPLFVTEPKKAIYRIYRDTRFSNNKIPYKTHLGASFTCAGMTKHISAGYYFGIGPEQIEIAGGIYMPGPDQFRAIRAELCETHAEFRRIINNKALIKLVGPMSSHQLTRSPKGFSPDHPADDLVRYKHWIFYDTRLDPKIALTPKIVNEIGKRFEAMTPFIDYLNTPLKNIRPDPMFVER